MSALPEYFEFSMPTRIVYGVGLINNLQDTVASFGTRKAILVTDKILSQVGLVDKVKAGFGKTRIKITAVFDDVPPNSTIEAVEGCAALARKHQCDMIIGLGGGSVMDTAKVANILMCKGGDIHDHMGAFLLGDDALLPSILIPTTAGTGSEVTKVAIIADLKNDIKLPFAENQFYPDIALLDPELTTSMPPALTAATGMDALTHAIESYVSKEHQPAADALALHVIKLINQNLLRACAFPDDLQARGAMQVASCLAGVAFSQTMVGMVHGISHALGGVYHIPHGLANALVLPEVMEYNLDAELDRYADIAEALGVVYPKPVQSTQSLLKFARLGFAVGWLDHTQFVDRWIKQVAARAGVARVKELNRQLGGVANMALNLSDAGVSDNLERLDQVVETAMVDGSMLYNPREVEATAVREIVYDLYHSTQKPIAVDTAKLKVTATTARSAQMDNVFDNADMLYDVLGNFYSLLLEDKDLGEKLAESNLCVQFRYSHPDAVITIDASGEQPRLYLGDTFNGEPEVTMVMKADVAHLFWQGKVNLVTALTKRQVKAKGNVPKTVKLLPILKPAYDLYPKFLADKGLDKLVA